MIGPAFHSGENPFLIGGGAIRSFASVEERPLACEFRPFELADPFDFYARARAEQPVFFSEELGYWVVTRYADIHAIFKAPKVFSSENTQAPYKPRPAAVERVLDAGNFRAYSGLSGRQPPEHTRLRGIIAKAFTPRRTAVLEPQIRELTRSMLDRFAHLGEADLVVALTHELPALVIFRLLGIPDEDVPRVKEWAASRVYLNFGDAPVAEQVAHAENLVRYWRYCIELIEARRAAPQDDLPSDLVRIGDEEISLDEMAGLVYGQLTAGHETTSALLAGGIKELLEQRARWVELCEDPSLIPNAVEELLRLVTPVFAWKRRAKEAAVVGGVEIPAGGNVLLLLGSANHDDTVFADPACIDPRRENARSHLAFGHGIHFCLGASLARLEARVVLEELTARLPSMELEAQTFDYPANTTFRAPVSVHVRWPVLDLRDSLEVELVGGKAASLGTLLRAGFPVPGGFTVTADAARERCARRLRRTGRGRAGRGALQRDDRGRRRRLLRRPARHLPLGLGRRRRRRARGTVPGEPGHRARAGLPARSRARRGPHGGRRAADVPGARGGRGDDAQPVQRRPLEDRRRGRAGRGGGGRERHRHARSLPRRQGHARRGLDARRGRRTPCLSGAEVRAVASLAKDAERHYGRPQDIEWAIDAEGRVVLLQSRPETAWSNKAPRLHRRT